VPNRDGGLCYRREEGDPVLAEDASSKVPNFQPLYVPCEVFNGQLVHGSQPNSSENRFRPSFICPYIGCSSERISKWYRPILTMDGEEVRIEESTGGGPCGTEDAGVH
jgi:hypothetical protein